MSDRSIFESLCSYDPRNPLYADLVAAVGIEDMPEPRKDCYCDNCFHGHDEHALRIIELQEALEVARSLIIAHHNCLKRVELGGLCPHCVHEDGTEPEMDQIARALTPAPKEPHQ